MVPAAFPASSGAFMTTQPDDLTPGKSRYQLLDLLRGLALVAMAVFHFGWDLYYFGWSRVDVTTDPGWTLFQKAICRASCWSEPVSCWRMARRSAGVPSGGAGWF